MTTVVLRSLISWKFAVDAGMPCGLNCGRDVEDMKTIIDVMEQIQLANVLMQTKPR
jgi:hypothetical protein